MKTICSMDGLRAATAVPRGAVALRYEQQERQHYRDCLLFYCDGGVLFERYCYGEAASLVFAAWVREIDADGVLVYEQPLAIGVKTQDLPRKLELLPDGRLSVDGGWNQWAVAATLREDKKNGYGAMKRLTSSFTK